MTWIVSPPFAGALDVLSYDIIITEFNGTAPGTLGSDDEVMLMISLDCGAYFLIKEYNSSNGVAAGGQFEVIPIAQYGSEVELPSRYQWYCSDGEDNDVFIDNILIEPGNQFDAVLLGQLSLLEGDCGDSTMMGELQIANFGLDTLSNLPIEITVTEIGGASVVFNDTFLGHWHWVRQAFGHGPFDTYTGGEFEMQYYMLAGDQVPPTIR